MDLSVGGRCEAYGCGAFDFLPIKCDGCQKLYCGFHMTLDSHACTSFNTNFNDVALQNQSYKRKRCAFHGCQKSTLESVVVDTTNPEHRIVAVCPNCCHAFCAIHRHRSDHACLMIPPASTPQKNPEAHELLSKHFPAKPSSVSNSFPSAPRQLTDPKKIARLRAVELMKIRHHALPADPKDRTSSIPPTQRLHLKIIVVGDAPPEKIFWFRKTVGTGRALDLLATQFSINISDTTVAFLAKLLPDTNTSARLRNDQLLAGQVEDGETLCLSIRARA